MGHIQGLLEYDYVLNDVIQRISDPHLDRIV